MGDESRGGTAAYSLSAQDVMRGRCVGGGEQVNSKAPRGHADSKWDLLYTRGIMIHLIVISAFPSIVAAPVEVIHTGVQTRLKRRGDGWEPAEGNWRHEPGGTQ
mgnify:CR=1 FL=1